MLTVYIGYDEKEDLAYKYAVRSIRKHNKTVPIVKLDINRLTRSGLMTRPVCTANNQQWDVLSDAPQSTAFAVSRFLVPIIHQSGPALFMDCDVIVQCDVMDILKEMDESKAVQVVKHDYLPAEDLKMDGQIQTKYPRKNWSSVMLFNCDHDGCRRLRISDVNRLPGRELHAFSWLHDSEIGELTPSWNWLVNVTGEPSPVNIAHFTLGGPWIKGWESAPHDEIWRNNISVDDEWAESVLKIRRNKKPDTYVDRYGDTHAR